MYGIVVSALLVFMTGGLAASEPAGPLVIAKGNVVTVDGTIGAEEWKEAKAVKVGGNEYLFQTDGEFLCIAVRGVKQAILTVAIESEKGVRVLHASASLGEAGYEKRDGGYARTSGFEWTCSDNSKAAEDARAKEREEHLATKGWVGATIGRGEHQPEMKIRLSELRGAASQDGAAITVNVFSAMAMGKDKGKAGDRWPEDVRDDTTAMGLRMGNAPEKAGFAVETWKRIAIEAR